jgi:hypothetical protein
MVFVKCKMCTVPVSLIESIRISNQQLAASDLLLNELTIYNKSCDVSIDERRSKARKWGALSVFSFAHTHRKTQKKMPNSQCRFFFDYFGQETKIASNDVGLIV